MQERKLERTTTFEKRSLCHHQLRVWHKAIALVKLVQASPIGDAELLDQAGRACRSVALNIAEGAAMSGAAKRRHYVIARGSVVETAAAYELARAIGESVATNEVVELAAEISAILNALVR